MPAYATRDDVEEIVNKAVNGAVDGLSEVILSFAQNAYARFDRVDVKLDKIGKINSNYNTRVSNLENLVNKGAQSSN